MIDEAYLLLRKRFFIMQHIDDLDDIAYHISVPFSLRKRKIKKV